MNKIILIVFLLLMCKFAIASMAMPLTAINEKTKECAEFFMGDECVGCTLPEGWQSLKFGETCPSGYTVIEAQSECKPYKDTFCCTVAHSGANGDCDDVIVNDTDKLCAFVEDIDKCEKLPFGWERAKVNNVRQGRLCPSLDYKWLEEEIICGQE